MRDQRARFARRDGARGAQLSRTRSEFAEGRGFGRRRGDAPEDPALHPQHQFFDILQARDRARDANKGVDVKYIVPKEGSILWFDMLAIPKDAPHPDAAYAYINYIMEPKVTADITNFKRFANANAASTPYVLESVKDDPAIYPPPELRQKLAVQLADSPEQTRAITRLWQKFKTGQ
jgi:putrescine transport system substrate-binding protein